MDLVETPEDSFSYDEAHLYHEQLNVSKHIESIIEEGKKTNFPVNNMYVQSNLS